MSNGIPLTPQAGGQDIEDGIGPVDAHRNQPQSTSDHSTSDQSLPLQRLYDYGDSSCPLYFIYSKIAEAEDNKMVDRCQKDKDGTLIFSGLFSATIGALLTVSIPDLKPNSQDTSAFYLENIYQLFGNQNVSYPSIPLALAKPPAFSPPRYAVWVNSLWFLSLAVSLSGAVVATQLRNWAVQYISLTQSPWDTLAKRARKRALFAEGNLGPHVIWGTGDEPIYLHVSLLLFIAGGLIYLFNINRSVFYAVAWWVGYVTMRYTRGSVAAFFEPHDLFHTPLSPLALRIYLGISYLVFQVCSHIPLLHGLSNRTRRRYRDLSDRYSNGFLIGKRREAEEVASKPSSEIDSLILERILPSLDDDRSLETFFDAIPGFCKSKLTVVPLSFWVQTRLRQALDCFLDRTFSSNLVSESVRASRLITCLNGAHAALGPYAVSGILGKICNGHWDEALQSVEIGHALRLWGHSRDHDMNVRWIVACIIARARRRDDGWTILVKEAFGVPDRILRDSPAHEDSISLSILIHISRQFNRAGSWTSGILSSLSNVDIRNTLPELQHEFCTLWNEIAQEARNQGSYNTPAQILREIRHLYVALHQGTDAAPTAFTSSTPSLDAILDQPSSYPRCDIASHRPVSTTHVPAAISGTDSPPTQPGETPDTSPHRSTHSSPTDPSTNSEVRETFQAPTTTFPVPSSSPPSNRSLQEGVAAALQDFAPATTFSHPLEGTTQRDIVPPCAESDIIEILSTASTPAPAPTLVLAPTFTPPVLNESLASSDAGAASASYLLLPSLSAVGFSIPASPPPSRVPPFPDAEFLALLTSPTPSCPTSGVTLPRPRARVLVNTGNMCFSNAVLQLLVHSPPFWNLFMELGDLKRQRGEGGPGTGGGVTPLVDATVKLFEEFMFKEEQPPPQKPVQQATNSDEKKEIKVIDSFVLTNVYNAMKEKRQLRNLLDGQQQDAEEFFRLYLDALDEELLALLASISSRKVATAAPGVKECDVSQSSQTEIGFTAESVESPLMHIFGGTFRSTVRVPNKPDTITIENWRSLQLDIQHDSVHAIEDALARISHLQPVLLGPSEASQQLLFGELPPVLVVHLKRFLHDATVDSTVKISKPIQFAPELEIPLEIMAPVTGTPAEPVHYKLYGVLYHHGESAGTGRYTVDVLHPNGDSSSGEGWLHIDDEAVSAVGMFRPFRAHGNEQGDDRCAYMLLYGRTASVRTW